MAQYWVYLNNEVVGPYAVEQLIRLKGFSRQTMIRSDDASGKPANWISPADIPELAHIFKAVEEHLASPQAASPVKPPAKPVPVRSVPKPVAPSVPVQSQARISHAWVRLLLAALLIGGGIFFWTQIARRGAEAGEQAAAKALIENAQLPAASLYGTLHQYLQEKEIQPRWEFERILDQLYHVTLSWSGKNAAVVYAFEANTQAQTVRGLNTAAITLLSEGFPAPASSKPKPAAPPKKSPADSFPQAMDGRRQALESGDFKAVWSYFSPREKSEMAKAGMSQDGFIRFQNLTYHVDSAVSQSVLKTKQESDTEMLALIKQSQPGRADIFVKQLWSFDGDEWKLDDEEKRAASVKAPEPAAPAASGSPAAPSAPMDSSGKPQAKSLPGMGN